MWASFKAVIEMIWMIAKYPLIAFIIISVIFAFLVGLHYLFLYVFKGERPLTGEHNKIRSTFILKKLFYDLPKRYAKDIMNRDPEFFKYQGHYCFVGDQGAGKTIAMVEFTRRLKAEYPKSKILTNCKYANADLEITDWHPLVEYKNGKQGVIVQIDEIHNWFSSLQSKNFPPEMLEVICQNRKNRRVLLSTSQRFTRIAKPIREQVNYVCECNTFFGCFTIVHVRKPLMNSDAVVEKYKHVKWYCFVHDENLRNMYDTYHVIESLSKSGFKDDASINNNQVVNINTVQPKKSVFRK